MSEIRFEFDEIAILEGIAGVLIFLVADILIDSFAWKCAVCIAFVVTLNLWIWFKFQSWSKKIRAYTMIPASVLLSLALAAQLSQVYDKDHPNPPKYQMATTADLARSEKRLLENMIPRKEFNSLHKELEATGVINSPINPKDLKIFINDQPIEDSKGNISPVTISTNDNVTLTINLHNDSHKTLCDLELKVEIAECSLSNSGDVYWKEAVHSKDVGALFWRATAIDGCLNIGVPTSLSAITMTCSKPFSGIRGYIGTSAKDNPTLPHQFLLIRKDLEE